MRKEDYVRPTFERALHKKQWGIYYILKSMEQRATFLLLAPRYATAHPDYQIIRKHRSRFTHYYFYLADEVLGPMVLRAGPFLPFTVAAYLNGHSLIERQLLGASAINCC